MVTVKDLHFGYSKKKEVFSGLNLHLHGGHIYGLLGKNGSGKSTLLRNLYGLLYPRKGSIDVLNFNPKCRLPSFLQKVFMVPEEFHVADIHINELIKYHSSFYPQFDLEQFKKYLADFEIPHDQSLQQVSYGQKKKVLISLGLATNASLLLMDEPTNGLDIISKSQFRKIMSGFVTREKCIIISTHQVRDLENLIDRIMIIDDAVILLDRKIEDIARKLSFKLSQDDQPPADSLYSESSVNGTVFVSTGTGSEETKVDLELLYKSVMANPQKIKDLFGEQDAA